MSDIDTNYSEAAEIPVLAKRDVARSDAFFDALKNDEAIKRFGKRHFGSTTIWWAVSKEGFGSFVAGSNANVAVTRFTHLEFSTISEGGRVLKRFIFGRLLIWVNRGK